MLISLITLCTTHTNASQSTLEIIKVIDKTDTNFAFRLKSYSNFKTYPFNANSNILAVTYSGKKITPIGCSITGNCFISIVSNIQYLWTCDIDVVLRDTCRKNNDNFALLEWIIMEKKLLNYIYFWVVDGKQKETYNFTSKFNKKNAVNFKIAKLVGVKNPYAFAFIVSNNTAKKVEISDFYSENSRLKVKFPDGGEFIYQPKKDFKDIELGAGKSKFVKFDILKLLKESNEFSEKDFNYGISELIWEIKLEEDKVQKYTFKLLKTEKTWSKITKTDKGYKMPINEKIK